MKSFALAVALGAAWVGMAAAAQAQISDGKIRIGVLSDEQGPGEISGRGVQIAGPKFTPPPVTTSPDPSTKPPPLTRLRCRIST